MKFKGKCKVLHLERHHFTHWCRLGADLLESNSVEKDLEALVESRWCMNQQ